MSVVDQLMIFQNTSDLPTREARELVRLTFAEIDDTTIAVWLRNASAPYRGYTYNGVPEMEQFPSAKACQYLVTLGINPDNQYPVRCTPPDIEAATWQELLIATCAREAYHVRQFKQSEVHSSADAEAYALKVLGEFRKLAGNLQPLDEAKTPALDEVKAQMPR